MLAIYKAIISLSQININIEKIPKKIYSSFRNQNPSLFIILKTLKLLIKLENIIK